MKTFKYFASCVLCLAMLNVQAQQSDSEQTAENQKDVERIEVQGERPKLYYQSEYRKFQKNFVNRFNELVNDSEMEVICDMVQQTGSRMKKRNCQPRFISTIIARETQVDLSMGREAIASSNVMDRPIVQKAILKEYKKFQAVTAKLLNENPDLANNYVKMQDALTKIESFEK